MSTLDGGSVWVASPGGCRLGTLGDTMVTRQPKQVLQDTLADMMDLLVWCFCPPGSSRHNQKFEKIVFFVFMCSGLNIYWAEGLNDKIAS